MCASSTYISYAIMKYEENLTWTFKLGKNGDKPSHQYQSVNDRSNWYHELHQTAKKQKNLILFVKYHQTQQGWSLNVTSDTWIVSYDCLSLW